MYRPSSRTYCICVHRVAVAKPNLASIRIVQARLPLCIRPAEAPDVAVGERGRRCRQFLVINQLCPVPFSLAWPGSPCVGSSIFRTSAYQRPGPFTALSVRPSVVDLAASGRKRQADCRNFGLPMLHMCCTLDCVNCSTDRSRWSARRRFE